MSGGLARAQDAPLARGSPLSGIWERPEAPKRPDAREAHVWRIRLDAVREKETPGRLLSVDEQARADRFRFARDHDRFIAARSALRRILGGYLGIDPAAVRFRYGDRGKPALEGVSGLQFNTTHSGGTALVAVATSGDVGVDIEQVTRAVECDAIARRFFAPIEVEALQVLHGEARRRGFFICWTRKEALVKGLGDGLSVPLDAFAVMVPGEPEAVLRLDPNLALPADWAVWSLDVGPDFAAALAFRGRLGSVRFFEGS